MASGLDRQKTVLVTAGPTREKLDPVRFFSNESTGRLGFEIAREARRLGYRVILILGPTQLPTIKGVETIHIESANQLYHAVRRQIQKTDVLFMTSAVADFSPSIKRVSKIKRRGGLVVHMKQSKDILKAVAAPRIKQSKIYVGFCLETGQLRKNALSKFQDKNLDYLVATRYSLKKPPFGDNRFSPLLLSKSGKPLPFKPLTKRAFAKKLLRLVMNLEK